MQKSLSNAFLLSVLFSVLCSQLFAQKLPSIQEKSVLAPHNVKIDGKAGEWNNRLQAHNRNTEIDYTIANDKANLYIIIQSKDPVIVKKILAGGITVRINADGKKDNKKVAVSYQMVASTAKSQLGLLIAEQATATEENTKLKQTDSIVSVLNMVMNGSIKEIKVTGVSALNDSLISVYNTTGIKVGSLFDRQRNLTCELAIPLKYIDFLTGSNSKLNYQIVLNGLEAAETVYLKNPTPSGVISVTGIPRSMSGGTNSYISQIINSSTDFWGEYTLAK